MTIIDWASEVKQAGSQSSLYSTVNILEAVDREGEDDLGPLFIYVTTQQLTFIGNIVTQVFTVAEPCKFSTTEHLSISFNYKVETLKIANYPVMKPYNSLSVTLLHHQV